MSTQSHRCCNGVCYPRAVMSQLADWLAGCVVSIFCRHLLVTVNHKTVREIEELLEQHDGMEKWC